MINPFTGKKLNLNKIYKRPWISSDSEKNTVGAAGTKPLFCLLTQWFTAVNDFTVLSNASGPNK